MSETAELTLLANLGGEEGDRWQQMAGEPSVAAAAALWASLFGATARRDGVRASPWDEPAFEWLPGHGALAWWGGTRAAADPALGGHPLHGAEPDRVEAVHDKAFALRHGSIPLALRDIAQAFDPDELTPHDQAIRKMRECLDRWPAGLRRSFCLKPRLGSSGRGRVRGRDGEPDTPSIRGALDRLARCGGAILEPWLERTIDLSVAFHVRPSESGPPLELLGSLTSISRTAGVPLGHRGEIDSRGRIYSGSRFDDAAREAGSELALAASEAGFCGPCGIDGFGFRDLEGSEVLRPAVEFNARFTMGLVALGCLRRARGHLRQELGVEPGMRAGVLLVYETPGQVWGDLGADLVLPLAVLPDRAPERGPALVGTRDPAALDGVIAALRGTGADPAQ